MMEVVLINLCCVGVQVIGSLVLSVLIEVEKEGLKAFPFMAIVSAVFYYHNRNLFLYQSIDFNS